jgi:hypothetical protein
VGPPDVRARRRSKKAGKAPKPPEPDSINEATFTTTASSTNTTHSVNNTPNEEPLDNQPSIGDQMRVLDRTSSVAATIEHCNRVVPECFVAAALWMVERTAKAACAAIRPPVRRAGRRGPC